MADTQEGIEGDVPLWQWTAHQAVEALRAGQVTAEDLICVALARTNATDDLINALPTPLRGFPAAQHLAQLGTFKLPDSPEGHPWYSLAGLPICVKDLTSVVDMPFTEGSLMFKGRVASVDDPMVAALKRAGAVIVSKSNTPEFGAGAQTYNELFGITRNPWNLELTPGGSSGGSAAALAAGQVWGATGTDLGGSLRIPASFCGVVGIRPSPGLVPHISRPSGLPAACSTLPPGAGVLHSLSGPMARNVPDLCLLLDAMVQGQLPAGFPTDATSAPPTAPSDFSFFAAVQPTQLPVSCKAVTSCAYSDDLGLGPDVAPVDPEVAQICRAAARQVASILGVPLVEDTAPDCSDAKHIFVVLRGFKSRALAPICLSETGKRLVKQELQQEVQRGLSYSDEEVYQAAAAHADYQSRWAAFMDTHQLVMTPTVICPPFDAKTTWLRSFRGTTFNHYTDWFVLTWAISLLECPSLSLPVGFTEAGLPVGLQMVAAPRQDAALLSAAAAYERCNPHASGGMSCCPTGVLSSITSKQSM